MKSGFWTKDWFLGLIVSLALLLVNAVSSLLAQRQLAVPAWSSTVEATLFVLAAVYLMFVLPYVSARAAAGVTASLALLLVLADFALMAGAGVRLALVQPLALLVVGYAAFGAKHLCLGQPVERKTQAEASGSNRMLALAFQGQGQLDLAFDYFRKCPLDDAVMDNLYHLGLEFERKGQFNKAEAVFRHMAAFKADFRDLPQRLTHAREFSKTVVMGADSGGERAAPKAPAVTAQAAAPQAAAAQPAEQAAAAQSPAADKPMLGRYQLERELGKGAMGIVYLGKDPKIGRIVAIKTLALAEEFEAEELAEVKERFFREAETAGRLSHPNIVTIYDVGEDRNLCYIAMELLKGKDLVPYTPSDHLLPFDKVQSIIARVADALGYAHRQNIVHRDIKPANVMYEPEADQVKVADFGIARITDSSKTKTGMVLGTPSYMSPEQLSGKKVDGRSDLFSLGVTLYQMACGRLPFEGNSLGQLMFRITNEPAPDILAIKPSLPSALVSFLGKALAKEASERFQTGEEFAAALRAIPAGASAPAAASPGLDINL